ESFAIWTHALFSQPEPNRLEFDRLLNEVPESLRPAFLAQRGSPAAHRDVLLRLIDEAVAELTAREEQLRTGREAVERSLAADQAALPQDEKPARLWLRYYSESNSAFYRASRELERAQAEED